MISTDTIAFLVDSRDPYTQAPVTDFWLFVGRLNPRYVGAWKLVEPVTLEPVTLEDVLLLMVKNVPNNRYSMLIELKKHFKQI